MTDNSKLEEALDVARAQMGDDAAFVRLVRRYHSRLLYYVAKMLLRKDLAEDVMQEVWVIAWRRIGRLRAREAFAVWLYRIAHTETARLIRKESRYVELPENFAETTEDVKEEWGDASEEELVRLNEALERISPPLREAVTLRFLEGMDYEAIAQVTDVPVGTVRSRLHYAKQTLRREMEANHDGKE
jgi:RNA polymerase sigma-70 factor, ECF subfamily